MGGGPRYCEAECSASPRTACRQGVNTAMVLLRKHPCASCTQGLPFLPELGKGGKAPFIVFIRSVPTFCFGNRTPRLRSTLHMLDFCRIGGLKANLLTHA